MIKTFVEFLNESEFDTFVIRRTMIAANENPDVRFVTSVHKKGADYNYYWDDLSDKIEDACVFTKKQADDISNNLNKASRNPTVAVIVFDTVDASPFRGRIVGKKFGI